MAGLFLSLITAAFTVLAGVVELCVFPFCTTVLAAVTGMTVLVFAAGITLDNFVLLLVSSHLLLLLMRASVASCSPPSARLLEVQRAMRTGVRNRERNVFLNCLDMPQ